MSPSGLFAGVSDTPLQWHLCVGHPSLQKLRMVVPIESSFSSLGCESCELGKHRRASYQSRVNKRSSTPFELVQSGVRVVFLQ